MDWVKSKTELILSPCHSPLGELFYFGEKASRHLNVPFFETLSLSPEGIQNSFIVCFNDTRYVSDNNP